MNVKDAEWIAEGLELDRLLGEEYDEGAPSKIDDIKNNLAYCQSYKEINAIHNKYPEDVLKIYIDENILDEMKALKNIKTKHELNYSIGYIQGMLSILGSTSVITLKMQTLLNNLAYEIFINCGTKLNQLEQKGKNND